MKKDSKFYKFVNNETSNVIYLLTIAKDEANIKTTLENTKRKLAIENGIYIDSIYYIEVTEDALPK
ncbi:MAG: hypothetical protein ACHQHN_04785 [Sphingobacteriales bacterium]